MSLAALQAVCDLALPRACAGCAARGCALCKSCRDKLDAAGRAEAFGTEPTPCPPGFPPTWSQTTYDGVVAELLRAFKDGGRRDLGPRLAALLRGALAELVLGDPHCRHAILAGEQLVVCPVPSRPESVRERGREPTAELARNAVRGTRRLAVHKLLRVAGHGRDQVGLGAVERSVNVQGTMRLTAVARGLVPGRVCVVVDDIVTTGSTLVEARTTLSAAGAGHVAAATVAATQRHTGRQPFTFAGSVV